ncbi:MAG: hypothetical protein ACOC3Z_00990 [Nanoarchaeota archaeon]
MNYYVNGDTGNDSNDGLSWENAFATIQKALELAEYSSADNIYIEGGNGTIIYDEQIEILKVSDICLNSIYFDGKNYRYSTVKTQISFIGINNPTITYIGEHLFYAYDAGFNHRFYDITFDMSNITNYGIYQYDYRASLLFKNCIFNCGESRLFCYFWYQSGIIFDDCEINCTYEDFNLYFGGRYSASGELLLHNCILNFPASSYLYLTTYGIKPILQDTILTNLNDVEGNFANEIDTNNMRIEDFNFVRYGNDGIYYYSYFLNLTNMGEFGNEYSGSDFKFINCIIENNITMYYRRVKTFRNCVFLKETSDLFSRPDDETQINFKFENCIFKSEQPSNINEEYFENCVFETDPLLDENGVPTADSPCLPENWTGDEPIDTFIGWKNYYLEPSLSSLSIDGNKGDIDVSVIYTGYNDLNFNLEYSLDGSTWNQATIEYNENKELKGDNAGIENKILWKSKSDFLTDETSVQLRISGNDTINDSNTLTSSEFTVLNEPVLLVEPSISNLETTGTKGEIEVSLTVFDDFSIVYGEMQYLNNSNWYTCTLKYSNGNYFTASEIGEENTVLWDSENDFSINLNTKLRVRVTDSDYQTSDWIESISFNVNNLYIPPIINSLSLSSNTQDIEIRYEAQDDEYSILQTEIQYLNDEDWYSCTIDYNPALTSKSSFTGELNTLLWKSYEDIQVDLDTKLRIRVFDTRWSDWIETSEFSLLNGNIPPEVFWYSPLKFRLDEEEKIYFKIQKE